MPMTLPEPDEFEQAHSERLKSRIFEAISNRGGRISFQRFMEMALYEPGLGYYVAGTQKFGVSGDFVTAPEISPLFSRCLAQQCSQVLEQQKSAACILELGAGSGVMAADILLELERLDCLPDHYYILELSPELQQRQRATLQHKAPHLAGSVRWLATLEGLSLHGVVLANEVLDAMPVQCFTAYRDAVMERGVAWQDGSPGWCEFSADRALEQAVAQLRDTTGAQWPEAYHSEINPRLESWIALIAEHLACGAIILLDYGYPRSEYYHPQRMHGTLLGHYRQHATDDPFMLLGLQDLTASVDFTAVAEAGVAAGLEFAGYTTQSYFLLGSGLEAQYQRALERENETGRLALSHQIKRLTLPAEMGERFQVMAFTRDFDAPLQGFGLQDLSHRL